MIQTLSGTFLAFLVKNTHFCCLSLPLVDFVESPSRKQKRAEIAKVSPVTFCERVRAALLQSIFLFIFCGQVSSRSCWSVALL